MDLRYIPQKEIHIWHLKYDQMPVIKVPIGPNGDSTVVLLNKHEMFI